MSRLRLPLLALVLVALALAGATQAAPHNARKAKKVNVKKLFGQTGPGFKIKLTNYSFHRVRHLKPGRYTFLINDRSTLHDFHLVGPRVNKKTSVRFLGTKVWKRVRLRKGTYRYFCDAHKRRMHGSFRVR